MEQNREDKYDVLATQRDKKIGQFTANADEYKSFNKYAKQSMDYAYKREESYPHVWRIDRVLTDKT